MTTAPQKRTALAASVAPTADSTGAGEQPRRHGALRLNESKALIARRARIATGCVSPEQLSLRIGARVWLIKRQESRAYAEEARLGQMLADAAYGLSIAGDVAEHHGARIEPGVDIVHGDDHGARLASVTSETVDVLRVLTAALADGALTGAEPAAVRVEVKQAMDALRELDAACIAAERGARG